MLGCCMFRQHLWVSCHRHNSIFVSSSSACNCVNICLVISHDNTLSLPQSPHHVPVPECAAGLGWFRSGSELFLSVWVQAVPWDSPLLVWPGHRRQGLDRGMDQWRLCHLPRRYYLDPGATSTFQSTDKVMRILVIHIWNKWTLIITDHIGRLVLKDTQVVW